MTPLARPDFRFGDLRQGKGGRGSKDAGDHQVCCIDAAGNVDAHSGAGDGCKAPYHHGEEFGR
ncbi:MAG: hypothetical protein IPM83_10690 [Ignavibacteria bacterium]|nr:hypothetical protein [Ignavibacteria bacterium]